MEPTDILLLILLIITFDYLLEQVVDYLNFKTLKSDIPKEVAGFYDIEKYHESIQYNKTTAKFSFLTSFISFVSSFAMLSLGGFAYIDSFVAPYFENPIYHSLAYFGVLFLLSDLLNIPLQLYSTFVIEEKFGFNKVTPKLFIIDKLKGYVLGVLLGTLLLGSLLYLIINIGPAFWVYFWIVIMVFMLLANMFYTSLILPLFNKLTPLEDGLLKDAIKDYSKRVKFPLDNIFVIDGSKRSKKANAFFSGIGKQKKIVLYDTLIENHTTQELVAVLAHEVGHFKKKHVIGSYIMTLLQTGAMLFVMSKLIFSESLSIALGVDSINSGINYIHLNIIAFGILYSPISKVTAILSNVLSRKNEFEADAYAAETYKGDELSNALKRLSIDGMSNLFPHKTYVFLNYSHPPLMARLQALEK